MVEAFEVINGKYPELEDFADMVGYNIQNKDALFLNVLTDFELITGIVTLIYVMHPIN